MKTPDREKVIKGLECHQEPYGCPKCPYWDRETPLKDCDNNKLIADALAMLREQETTFVLEPDRTNHYHCEKCGYVTGIIARMHKFCPECGRAVKLDD